MLCYAVAYAHATEAGYPDYHFQVEEIVNSEPEGEEALAANGTEESMQEATDSGVELPHSLCYFSSRREDADHFWSIELDIDDNDELVLENTPQELSAVHNATSAANGLKDNQS